MRDPVEYTLRWPSRIVADEIEGLIALADAEGVSTEWADEVDTLLRQAFVSSVPAEDFQRVDAVANTGPLYDADEEPF